MSPAALHRISLGVSISVCCLFSATVQAADSPARWALLVGVDHYDYARGLKYCAADQRALSATLINAGFDRRHVRLMIDGAADRRLLPSKTNIKTQIELLVNLADPGDLALVGFSGHGVLLGGITYLCPSDAKLTDADSLISLDWVYQQLNQCKADLRLVMVDACRNIPPEPEGRRTATAAELRATSRAFSAITDRLPEGILQLNSCSEGEFAQEDAPLGHGVFTHFLLEGLSGKADKDGNKKISLNELFSYASKETTLYVRDKFAEIQRPRLKGNLELQALDFEVAAVSTTRPNLATQSPTLPKPPTSRPDQSTNAANAREMISKSTGMKFRLIPEGEFLMGLPDSQMARGDFDSSGAGPQNRVKISHPFFMGIYEVTQGEFEQVMRRNPSWFSRNGGGNKEVSGENTSRYPVENVNWLDAVEFCNRLSEKDGLRAQYQLDVKRKDGLITSANVSLLNGNGYRLPTEAEWEYACRANTTTPFEFGTTFTSDRANVNGGIGLQLPGTAEKDRGPGRTTTVGSYSANRFGLHDMHGNVCEWCFDEFDDKAYSKRRGTTIDPLETNESGLRVLRGGSWRDVPNSARSADRRSIPPDFISNDRGFRLVAGSDAVRAP